MTDTDREYIAGGGDVDSHKRYQAISRVRNRINEELAADVEILEEHHPGLLEELRETICEDDIAESGSPEETSPEPTERGGDTTEPETSSPEPSEESDLGVWKVVDEVSEGWDDDERLHNRRNAAAEVLQHALDTGEGVGKSSPIVKEVQEKYPVQGQNEETYWRKNIREVLSEVGEYSRGTNQYTVEDLER
jgi:hypothetical protein